MKKYIALVLAVILLLCCTGCAGNKAPLPEGYPDYTFKKTPTTDELRETAVRAMRDLLSIEWTPAETISYFNTAGRDKQFDYEPGTIYGGLLYTGASSGLFHFLEYYDPETGVLTYPGTGDQLRKSIGSGCADSLLWAWATVGNSFSCGYYPSMMVYKNGFLPVGDYTYNFDLQSYYMLPTQAIIEANGEKVIYDAYTKCLPADALISSSVDHAMMVIENPVVVYHPSGTIDIENSYIMIQDQRGGTSKGFLEEEVDGRIIQYNSARRLKMTFKELYEKNYIPVTIAEFTGAKAYDKAEVTLPNGECNSVDQLKTAMVQANYPIAVINILGTDSEGNEVEIEKILIHSASTEGPAREYDLGRSDAAGMDLSGYKRIKVEVVVSTGERFVPISFRP